MKLDKFPVFMILGNVCLFLSKWIHPLSHNSTKTEGHIAQMLNIMAVPMGHLTIKFDSNIFNNQSLLFNEAKCGNLIFSMTVDNSL